MIVRNTGNTEAVFEKSVGFIFFACVGLFFIPVRYSCTFANGADCSERVKGKGEFALRICKIKIFCVFINLVTEIYKVILGWRFINLGNAAVKGTFAKGETVYFGVCSFMFGETDNFKFSVVSKADYKPLV